MAPGALSILVERDDLDRLAAGWDRLASRSGSPIQGFAWTRAWAETLGEGYGLRVLVVGSLDEPVGIAPLAARRRPFASLELLGVRELWEPMDFLYADAAAAARLAEAVADLRAPLTLTRVPADSPTVALIEESYRDLGRVHVRDAGTCPYIHLDDGWADPEARLSSRRRSDLRRARRRAEQLGELSCELLSPGPSEVGPLLEEAFRVEAAGWKGGARTALALDPGRASFYEAYAATAASDGHLRVCFLRIGGQPVAMQLAVAAGESFWLLKIGYDEEFARCSPGSLLMVETIRYAAEHGLRAYEFLGTADSWTRVWTKTERPCVSLRAYPFRPRGLGALALDAASLAGRRLKRFGAGRR